jgi:hypothetical protein
MNTGAKNNFAFIDNNELPPICFSTDSVKEIREYTDIQKYKWQNHPHARNKPSETD